MNHPIKLWERVDERRLRKIKIVSDGLFGFISNRLMMEATFLLKQFREKLERI